MFLLARYVLMTSIHVVISFRRYIFVSVSVSERGALDVRPEKHVHLLFGHFYHDSGLGSHEEHCLSL